MPRRSTRVAAASGLVVGLCSTLALAQEAPFAFGDFTWMNGQSHQRTFPLTALGGAVTPSLYLDTYYAYSSNHPADNTLTGSTSIGRHNEVQVSLASVGFEWNYHHVIGRLSLQFGSMLGIVQDLDPTLARATTASVDDLRYIREAALGYHFNVGSGLNVEAGIFSSFISLESYLSAENWNFTHAIVSDHTPYYLQGVRVQWFPTPRVKIEPWLTNGWQTYGRWNVAPAAGLALRWSPNEAFTFLASLYLGTDTRGVPDRLRFHHEHSLVLRLYNSPGSSGVSKLAFSLNDHLGFESGGGLPGPGDAYVAGTSAVGRVWFWRDRLALSVRGEAFANPTSYLAVSPPPGFAMGPGTPPLEIYGLTGTFDLMPTDFLTLRFEVVWRVSNRGYFAGPGGTIAPDASATSMSTFAPDTRGRQTLFVVAANFRL